MHTVPAVLLGALALFCPSTQGRVTNTPYTVFEQLHGPPTGWTELSTPLSGSTPLTLQIHLSSPALADFEQKVLDISTPGHPSYGAHMSRDELAAAIAPADGAASTVLSWLDTQGLGSSAVVDHDWVTVNTTVSQAEALMQTKYATFQNSASGNKLPRTLMVRLPAAVAGVIDLIQPTTAMLSPKANTAILNSAGNKNIKKLPVPANKLVESSDVCVDSAVTPKCVRQLYNFENYTAHAGTGAIGVSGYLDEWVQDTDLAMFLGKYEPKLNGSGYEVVSISGGQNVQNPPDASIFSVAEANLDMQWSVVLTSPIKSIFYTTGGLAPFIPDAEEPNNANEPYLDQIRYLLDLDDKNLPNVLTTSYGEAEITVPLSYRLTVCNLYARLGARGVSILFASGDDGPGYGCVSNDGKNTTMFTPNFPASCPYVTAVGGTHDIPETAVSISSGGFSNTWERPTWQSKAVDAYLAENEASYGPFTPYFNRSGRAYPDIAAMAESVVIGVLGQFIAIGGTSAACPIVASVISLVNDDRIASGKRPLGWLNPLLYQHPEAFNDIISGRTSGCPGPSVVEGGVAIPNAGWDAVKGWDPATGLGTPDFEKLRALQ